MKKSNLSDNLKCNFFRATVESILMYGTTVWTLTKTLSSPVFMAHIQYSKVLRSALNLSWRQHPTKQQLYGPIPPLTSILRKRKICFVGHCWRAKQELISDLLLWFHNGVKVESYSLYIH